MKPSEQYALEKFETAVDALATGPEGIRIRLRDAFSSFHTIAEDDFTADDLRKDYRFIMGQLTKYKAQGREGQVQASLAQLTDDECIMIAEAILRIHAALCEQPCVSTSSETNFRRNLE